MYKIDGYDDAIIGVAYDQPVAEQRLIYDKAKILEILMVRDKMSYTDASEWVEDNIVGAFSDTSYPILARLGPSVEALFD